MPKPWKERKRKEEKFVYYVIPISGQFLKKNIKIKILSKKVGGLKTI